MQNHPVRTRLLAGFGILLALLAVLGGAALLKMAEVQDQLDDIALDNNAKTTQTEIMFDRTGQVAVLIRNIALMDDPAYATEQMQVLAGYRDDYKAAREALDKLPAGARGLEQRARIDAARDAAMPLNDEVLRLASLKLDDEAKTVLLEQAAPAVDAWQDALRENLIVQAEANEAAYAAALASYRQGRVLLIVIALVALGVGILLAFTITSSLVKPLGEATRLAREIAAGNLNGRVQVDGRDEVAALLGSMREMQQGLQRFADAQGEMAREHEAGTIDHRIDASRFNGAYAQMAEQINTLVGAHIAVKMRVIDIVAEYARGDLSRDMDKLPGQKARVTDAVESVKASMQAVNGEIKALVDAAVAGDFSRRGDAARFEFVYREMVEDLNALMESADRGLSDVGRLLNAVAEGDLGQRADDSLPGQFGRLAGDANRTVATLAGIVAQIRAGSDAISSAAGEIAAGNNDLSQRTEQQAASLEETASSMEELTSTVKQTADNARQASELATGAADNAVRGGGVAGQMVQTMGAINESSRRIVDIISVIDGIAFQTNILALNAAVEAARAGEQGRGFAVVASEVRSLAQRSANAAKEIKQLIADSVEKVEDGTALVNRAGEMMGEIVGSVKQLSDVIADISAASQEQSAGIEQINQAVLQMDEGTQQNAALVEEASAAARSLEQQSGHLVQTVAAFRLTAGDGAQTTPIAITRVAEPGPPVVASASASRHAPARRPAARPAAPAATRASRSKTAANGQDQHWQEF